MSVAHRSSKVPFCDLWLFAGTSAEPLELLQAQANEVSGSLGASVMSIDSVAATGRTASGSALHLHGLHR